MKFSDVSVKKFSKTPYDKPKSLETNEEAEERLAKRWRLLNGRFWKLVSNGFADYDEELLNELNRIVDYAAM